MSDPLVLSIRDVEVPYTGFNSIAENAIQDIKVCKEDIEDWVRRLDRQVQ